MVDAEPNLVTSSIELQAGGEDSGQGLNIGNIGKRLHRDLASPFSLPSPAPKRPERQAAVAARDLFRWIAEDEAIDNVGDDSSSGPDVSSCDYAFATWSYAFAVDDSPQTLNEAMSSDDAEQWEQAAKASITL